MILKASQRGGGQDLAAHLMRMDENEHVELHEIRGFAAEDLKGAFKEARAVSLGTKCSQYLFSLSLSPPEGARVGISIFENAIERIEERLGLEGQPRAIVFHEKEGRRHAHCVWSRVDPESMTARQLSFFKMRLTDISRNLYLENGWDMPRGLRDKKERDPLNFTHAEWQAAKRFGEDPRWLKATVQNCWSSSDTRKGFEAALAEKSLLLAQGDKRGFVLVDFNGTVHSLPRVLGVKAKDVRAKLGSDAPRTVEEAKKQIADGLGKEARAKIQNSRERFSKRQSTLKAFRAEMAQLHRGERKTLTSTQVEQWAKATRERQERLPRGLKGLWSWISGKTAIIKTNNEAEAKAQAERQSREREDLIARQLEERRLLQEKVKELRKAQASDLLGLRRELAPHLTLRRDEAPKQEALSARLSLKLE